MSKKILLSIFALMIVIVPFTKVEAKTLGDLRNELADLEKKYAEAENNKNLTDAEIKKLTAEINEKTASIEKIKEDIRNTETNIINNEKEIEEKREETNELLKFLQVSSGENVYLEYIFEADSYTDFIYRYSVVSQLTEYNNNLMDELEKLVKELEEKKVELDSKRKKLEKESSDLTSKVAILRVNLEEYKEVGTSIEEDIKDLKESIKRYEQRGCKDSENILTCGSGGMVNATGWKYPLSWGCVTSEYVGFGDRLDWSGPSTGHHAIDLDCVSEGTPVYAAAPGKVARTRQHGSRYDWDCGGNMVWIYHNINGMAYTTVYMHLLSYTVSADQYVDENTIIGYVGGGSTAYSNGGYDRCTSGAHLHFGTAYGHNASNFNNYSFNPRNVYNFPALVYSGGGYFRR